MGLFNMINGKYKEFMKKVQEAEEKAEYWDVEKICNGIESSGDMATMNGYGNALKNKCRGMSDYELEGLLDYIYARRNVKALNIIGRFMEDRGLLEKIDNGHYRRTY